MYELLSLTRILKLMNDKVVKFSKDVTHDYKRITFVV